MLKLSGFLEIIISRNSYSDIIRNERRVQVTPKRKRRGK